MRRNRLEDFAIGALAGAALGFLAGLLYAPVSGEATRRRLAEEAHRAAGVARDIAERAEHAAEALGGRVEHYLGRDEEVAWRKVEQLREGVKGYTKTDPA